jgi:hypothetical protein
MNRREFLRGLLGAACVTAMPALLPSSLLNGIQQVEATFRPKISPLSLPGFFPVSTTRLDDGRVLCLGCKNTAEIWLADSVYGSYSTNGKNWTAPFEAKNIQGLYYGNLLNAGNNVLFALGIPSFKITIYKSTDAGVTWTNAVQVNTGHSYNTGSGGSPPVEMRSGTLIFPIAYALENTSDFASSVIISKDMGKTWRKGGEIHIPETGLDATTDEPAVVELSDFSLYALLRTERGHHYYSTSTNEGSTWTTPKPSTLINSDSPPSLIRLSFKPNLVMVVWNPVTKWRNPLSIAFSSDDCKTWTGRVDIANTWACYPTPVRSSSGDVFINYWTNGFMDQRMVAVSGLPQPTPEHLSRCR